MENTIKKLNRCRLCATKNYSLLFTRVGYEVAKCNICGFVFLNFDPDASFFSNFYSAEFFNDSGTRHAYNDYESEAQSMKKTFANRVDALRKYGQGGSLVDIGCATGAFMERATRFWKTYGIDVSRYAIDLAKKKNLDVVCGDLLTTQFNNQKFDVVTLWDTIEHVTDPRSTLKRIYEITNTGGVVALTTGDVGSLTARLCGKFWHLYNIPQHLSFFSKQSITDILKETGFSVREISYPPLTLTTDYLAFRLVTFYKLNFALPLYKFLKKFGFLKYEIKINLYDIMFVIATKN